MDIDTLLSNVRAFDSPDMRSILRCLCESNGDVMKGVKSFICRTTILSDIEEKHRLELAMVQSNQAQAHREEMQRKLKALGDSHAALQASKEQADAQLHAHQEDMEHKLKALSDSHAALQVFKEQADARLHAHQEEIASVRVAERTLASQEMEHKLKALSDSHAALQVFKEQADARLHAHQEEIASVRVAERTLASQEMEHKLKALSDSHAALQASQDLEMRNAMRDEFTRLRDEEVGKQTGLLKKCVLDLTEKLERVKAEQSAAEQAAEAAAKLNVNHVDARVFNTPSKGSDAEHKTLDLFNSANMQFNGETVKFEPTRVNKRMDICASHPPALKDQLFIEVKCSAGKNYVCGKRGYNKMLRDISGYDGKATRARLVAYVLWNDTPIEHALLERPIHYDATGKTMLVMMNPFNANVDMWMQIFSMLIPLVFSTSATPMSDDIEHLNDLIQCVCDSLTKITEAQDLHTKLGKSLKENHMLISMIDRKVCQMVHGGITPLPRKKQQTIVDAMISVQPKKKKKSKRRKIQ